MLIVNALWSVSLSLCQITVYTQIWLSLLLRDRVSFHIRNGVWLCSTDGLLITIEVAAFSRYVWLPKGIVQYRWSRSVFILILILDCIYSLGTLCFWKNCWFVIVLTTNWTGLLRKTWDSWYIGSNSAKLFLLSLFKQCIRSLWIVVLSYHILTYNALVVWGILVHWAWLLLTFNGILRA
jgi:hypothetical protein